MSAGACSSPMRRAFRHPVVLYDGLKNVLLDSVPALRCATRTRRPVQSPRGSCFGTRFLRIFIDLFRNYPTHRLALGTGQTLNIVMTLAGLALLARSRLRRLGRLPATAASPHAPRVGADVRPPLWPSVALGFVLAFCLTIPSNWTQDVPARYGRRHPGLEHSRMYPRIDTAPRPSSIVHRPSSRRSTMDDRRWTIFR